MVHFLLRLAPHEKRNRRRKLEIRVPVQRSEILPLQLEFHQQHLPFQIRKFIAIMQNLSQLRLLEYGRIKLRRRFRLAAKPQKCRYLLHRFCSFYFPLSSTVNETTNESDNLGHYLYIFQKLFARHSCGGASYFLCGEDAAPDGARVLSVNLLQISRAYGAEILPLSVAGQKGKVPSGAKSV